MKKFSSSLWMISSLLGLLLATESCRFFKSSQEPNFQETPYEPYGTSEPVEDCDSECPFFLPEEFKDHLSDLFEIQGQLLNDVLVASLNSPSQEIIENGQSNLFDNTHELANLFATVYGEEVANRIEIFLNRQAHLFLAYFNAIKSNNKAEAKALLVDSYSNGHQFVELINVMNPFFSYEFEKHMLDEHVTLESDQAIAYLKGDFERAEMLKFRSINQLKELARQIAKAIHTQMADEFYESNRFPPNEDCFDDE